MNRRALAAAALAVSTAAACTTSRATLAWHHGWAAEQAGNSVRAEAHYMEAWSLDPSLVGAACNSARLIAQHPDRKADARALVEKIMKTKGTLPEAAACGAMFALVDGDTKLARQRLEGARAPKPEDSPATAAQLASVRTQLLAAEGRWQDSMDAAVALPGDATAAHFAAAVAAWNVGAPGRAGYLLQSADSEIYHVLAAWSAAGRQEWPTVLEQLALVPEAAHPPHLQALRAWALLSTGQPGEALAVASDAARRDAQDSFCAETWGVAALASRNPAQARDLLGTATLRSTGWTAWYHLGLAQVQLGDLRAALSAFDQAAIRCPTCGPALRNRDVLRKALN